MPVVHLNLCTASHWLCTNGSCPGMSVLARLQEKEAAGRGDKISESSKETQGAVGIAEADVSRIPIGMGR